MQKGGLLQNKANPPLFQISFSSVKYVTFSVNDAVVLVCAVNRIHPATVLNRTAVSLVIADAGDSRPRHH